jgi:sec-independent protein translocase protein TatC
MSGAPTSAPSPSGAAAREAQGAARGGANGAGDAPAAEDAGKTMTIWEHLEELRRRLVWSVVMFFGGCVLCWNFHTKLLSILVKPFADSWLKQNISGVSSLHFATPAAAFAAYVKLSMLGGLVVAAPFIFYQLWAFIAPGLYAREKRIVVPFVMLSTGLFVGGIYFGYRAAFPFTFNYFLSLSGNIGNVEIKPTVMMGEYIDFALQMLLGFGLVFEIPLILLFLSIVGIVNHLTLIKFGRWYVLLAFIVAALFTPPDVTSQLVMAIPMCILYFVSIGLVYLFGKPPTEAQREAFWGERRRRKQAKKKQREE